MVTCAKLWPDLVITVKIKRKNLSEYFNYELLNLLWNDSLEARAPSQYKISSYRYRDSHYKDKMVSWPSYLYNGNLHTWKECLYIEKGPRWCAWSLLFRNSSGEMWGHSGGWFDINMSSYQYKNSYCGDKMSLWLSYISNTECVAMWWHHAIRPLDN